MRQNKLYAILLTIGPVFAGILTQGYGTGLSMSQPISQGMSQLGLSQAELSQVRITVIASVVGVSDYVCIFVF